MNSYIYDLARKGKLNMLLLLVTFIILFIFLNISYPVILYAEDEMHLKEELEVEEEEEWNGTEVEGSLSRETYRIYKKFFKRANFELMGKLLTLFLAEEGKGYRITQLDDNLYEIQSRKTIQEGSTLYIESLSPTEFSFSGTLIIEKLITFECEFRADIDYQINGDDIRYMGDVDYQKSGMINGLNSFASFFKGEDYISYKLHGFLNNLHLVFEKLSLLNLESWQELIDSEELSNLVFPLDFSKEELDIFEEILKP